MPRVDILLCSYNGADYIEEQLDSLLAQDYPNFFIHVFDDNSSDETCAIVLRFCNRHRHIALHKNQKRLGFVKNFEDALLKTRGEYFALCDQDDVWQHDKLSVQMCAMLTTEQAELPMLIHSDLQMVDVKLEVTHASFLKFRQYQLTDSPLLHRIVSHNGVMGCTVLMNQAMKIKALPFPDGLAFHDYWLALVAEVAGQRLLIDKPLVNYRIHQTNSANQQRIFSLLARFNYGQLPYLHQRREQVLQALVERFQLTELQLNIIFAFKDYLEGIKSPWLIMRQLRRFDIFFHQQPQRWLIDLGIVLRGANRACKRRCLSA